SSEMNSAFPPAALSAQAVAARSFALSRIKRSSSRLGGADVTDDIFTQVYRGEERTTQKIYETVDHTRGVILIYNGRLFDSIFHDTCGGQTEPVNLIWDGPFMEPLKGRICGYCYGSKFNHWSVTIDEQEIIKKLSLENASSIDDIRVIESAPGGHARTLGIKIPGKFEEMIISAQPFRIALGPNKLFSTYFKIKKIGNTFEFSGRGWGHGVGLCQEGTRGMTEKGFNTLQVLEYYYPGAKVVKIY
ncbi:MAG: SpoIID/LytB domain-containing protein, partial [Planctomycetota bacterium]